MTDAAKDKELRPCPFCGGRMYGANGFWACDADIDLCHFSGFKLEEKDINSAYCWEQIDALNARVEEFKALSDSYWDQLCKKDGEIEALRSAGKKLFNQLKEYDDMMWPEGTHVILSETADLFSGEKGEGA